MLPTTSLLGVVLAGGRSSRMGTSKALLRHQDGDTFLQQSIERLRELGLPVGCSIAADQKTLLAELPSHIKIFQDEHADLGPVEGLRLGLDFAISQGCIGVLVTPVDTPNLTITELTELQTAFYSSPAQIVCGVSDRTSDRLEPLIAVYPTGLAEDMNRLAKSNDRSLYRFIENHNHQRVVLPDSALKNVNRPEDWNL